MGRKKMGNIVFTEKKFFSILSLKVLSCDYLKALLLSQYMASKLLHWVLFLNQLHTSVEHLLNTLNHSCLVLVF